MMKPAMQFLALLARNTPRSSGSGTVINLGLVLGILITVCVLEMTCDCLVETLLAAGTRGTSLGQLPRGNASESQELRLSRITDGKVRVPSSATDPIIPK